MLLLFDVDGTLLLRAFAAHREALHAAIRDVHGVREPREPRIDAAGRTDGEIARLILLEHGLSAERIDARMDELRGACVREFAHRCPDDLRPHLAPGVPSLLEALTGRDGTILALVTGNLEPIARLKLERAGIGHFFARGQGGFGSDSEDRAALPAIARRRAGTERPYPRERTIVIGDTPRDIACARADGVRCLAVATGPYDLDDLRGADAVAADAAALRPLLEGLVQPAAEGPRA